MRFISIARVSTRGLLALIVMILVHAAAAGGLDAQAAAHGTFSPRSDPTALQELRTPLEASGYEKHTLYPEMVDYLQEVRARSTDMTLGVYGQTHQGRDLFYAIYSRPAVRSPAEAHASGKPVILLTANSHGHNHTLREALLIMLRDLGQRGTELNRMLDDVIVIVVPNKNPDGLVAETRYNAHGADLNRDYMVLEHPETAAYVGNIVNEWHPHLIVDGHNLGAIQYGGAYPYHVLYQSTGHAGADPTLTALADEQIFPLINRSFEAAGFNSFYWARGDTERWYGGGTAPRMERNYGGLANKLTILFEMSDWPGPREAVASGIVGFTTVLEFARDQGDELMTTVLEARRRTIELGEMAEGAVPVEERLEAEDFRVTYQIRPPEAGPRPAAGTAPDGSAIPAGGGPLLTVSDAEIIKKAVGTRFRDRPYAYLLPPGAVEVARLLRRHNITVERLTAPAAVDVQAYTLAEVRFGEGSSNYDTAVRVEVGEVRQERIELPEGAYLVRTGQLLGRVVTQLLEAENEDNVVYWNRMTSLLPIAQAEAHAADPAGNAAPLIPIYKLMEARPLPTVLLP